MTEPRKDMALPRVFGVTANTRYAREIEGALARHFDFSLFTTMRGVGKGMLEATPDVVVVDVEITRKQGVNGLSAYAAGHDGTSAAFVFIAKHAEDFGTLTSQFGRASRCLVWPVSTRVLIGTISDLVSRSAEQAWDALPEIQSKPLRLTVAEYKDIATAIENGTPIDYNSAASSCAPLVAAVRENAHHDLLRSVQSHHNYTYVHSMRVATLLTLFGHGIGMNDADLLILSTGGLLHDVGKLVTPSAILDKPGKLSDDEWTVMRDHVVSSGSLLQSANDITRGVRVIAEQHHEKLDGSGYPRGLKGAEINELARMSAIADIFGALTDKRAYKPAFPAEKAFRILEGMQAAIDQHLLGIFKDIFISTHTLEDDMAA